MELSEQNLQLLESNTLKAVKIKYNEVPSWQL